MQPLPITRLTPEILLTAYKAGIFPMSNSRRNKDVFWVNPELRAIIPLDNFHVPKNLKKQIRKQRFEISFDRSFKKVIQACARPRSPDNETWINEEIIVSFIELFNLGYGHTVECWENNKLVGGLYGLAIGSAFFGESMFSLVPNASKVALVNLIKNLNEKG
ncbi:MAG: leucyl/phenylalanyl-tRNA--protein transferase, partial [Pseudomonadota bacterium]|nr:leucyl/phenylalanyl-tRNA--protein transferase [Pseudomonadota bacterium]